MTKKQLLSLLTISALALSQAGVVHADDVIPVDTTAPVTVAPSEPTVPAPIEQPSTQPSQPTQPTNPTIPSTPPNSDATTPVDPTIPTTPSNPDPDTTTPGTDNQGGNQNQSGNSSSDVTDPISPTPQDKDKEVPDKSNEPSTPSTAPNDPGLPSSPAEQPRTTDQANQAGTSQVGTISSSTGQVVQSLATPIVTDTGVSISSTQNGQLILSDGTVAAPEAVGASTNPDQTISVRKADGSQVTLPTTGDKTSSYLSLLGMVFLFALGLFAKKKSS